jgi:DNA-binding response OmpR family regulator
MAFDVSNNGGTNDGEGLPQSSIETLRVLVLADVPETRTVLALLSACDLDCSLADEACEVHAQLLARSFDVVIVPMATGADEVCSVTRKLQPHASLVMVTDSADVLDVTGAMRAGAVDVLIGPPSSEEIENRIRLAGVRSRALAQRERRADRIRGLSRRIDDTRRQLLAAIEAHENENENEQCEAQESAIDTSLNMDQPVDLEMCSEFKTLVEQELDVEDLLRTSLEYMLVKTGPTNAAVFLAGEKGCFGLGAYVHYDLPRRLVDPMLQRLADEACPAISDTQDVLRFEDAESFICECELGADVATNQQMVAVPCLHEGNCLAILILFRSESEPFEEPLAGVLDVLRPIFAEQLARLIRVHNRLSHEWPDEPADEDPGYGDLAA